MTQAKKVKKVKCKTIAPSGKVKHHELVSKGDWSWYGNFNADEVGEWAFKIEAIDDKNKLWETAQTIRVLQKRIARPEFPQKSSCNTSAKRNLYPLWIYHTGSVHVLQANPTVVGGLVYVAVHNPTVGFNDNGILCLDAKTGKQIWHAPSPRGVIRGPVTVYKGKVYVLTAEGWAGAFDAWNGAKIWSRPLRPQYQLGQPRALNQTPPIPTDQGILFHNWGEAIYLMDYDTGEEIREFKNNLGIKGRNFPAVKHGIMYFARRGGVFAINMTDNQIIWNQEEKSRGPSTVLLLMINFIYNTESGCKAMDLKTGELLWQGGSYNTGYFTSAPVVWDDLVIVNGKDLRAFDLKTGQTRWLVGMWQTVRTVL